MAVHVQKADLYLRHLSGQWADRTVYWQARARAKTSKDILVMMVDGMDRGKYHLPRWTSGRAPKACESLTRPACEVYATLLHGRCLCVYISDCDQTSGSNFVIEVISRTLDRCFKQSQQGSDQSWPSTLQLWSDNTPKDLSFFTAHCCLMLANCCAVLWSLVCCQEVKNGLFSSFAASLVSLGYFRTISEEHLVMGHTHEDLDAFFGMLSRFVKESDDKMFYWHVFSAIEWLIWFQDISSTWCKVYTNILRIMTVSQANPKRCGEDACTHMAFHHWKWGSQKLTRLYDVYFCFISHRYVVAQYHSN